MDAVIKKLRLFDKFPALVLNCPKECNYLLTELKNMGPVHTATDKKSSYPAAIAFAEKVTDLKKFAPLMMRHLADDAVFWIAYPKKSSKKYKSDITRDEGWQVVGEAGYEGVSLIAIDEDWSALRFRKPEKMKAMIRRQSMAMSEAGKNKTSNKSNTPLKPVSPKQKK